MGLLSAIKSTKAFDQTRGGFDLVPWTWSLDDSRLGSVSATAALGVSAFWAGVRVLAEDIAKLPLPVYTATPNGREADRQNPLWLLFNRRANPEMTAFTYRELLMLHCLIWGDHFGDISQDRAGRPLLYPLRPDRMELEWDSQGRKKFTYTDSKGRRELDPAKVFHVPAISLTGLGGMSAIAQARQTVSAARSADRMAGSFWDNGANPKIVLTVPKGYPDAAKVNLKNAWVDAHAGPSKAFGTAMLEDGVTVAPLTMPLDDAQFLETRKFHVDEAARWLRIPPHKIGGLERATFSNIEQQSLDYVVDSLMPWCRRIESQAMLTFLPDDPDTYIEFQMDALLRGDALSRSSALQIQHRNGVLTKDEWRRIENRNDLPDGLGTEAVESADLKALDDGAPDGPTKDQVEEAGALIRAGYEAAAAAAAVGLDPIAHTGLLPVTVQPPPRNGTG